jgi:hypothetical protein
MDLLFFDIDVLACIDYNHCSPFVSFHTPFTRARARKYYRKCVSVHMIYAHSERMNESTRILLYRDDASRWQEVDLIRSKSLLLLLFSRPVKLNEYIIVMTRYACDRVGVER